jgi:hypothetical protein
MTFSGSGLGRNIRLCVAIGLAVAVLFSAFVVVLVAVKGGSVLEGYDTTLRTVVATYLAGGLVGGAIVGALLPIGRRWYGAMLLGYIGALPVYGVVLMATRPVSQWMTDSPFLFYGAGPIGAAVGLGLWFEFRREGEI